MSQEWISAKDRLPDYGVPVWVVYHGVVQDVTYRRDREVGWTTPEGIDSDPMPASFVSHWQPMPEPPKAGQP